MMLRELPVVVGTMNVQYISKELKKNKKEGGWVWV